jgi:hypothetical protein
MSKPAFPIPGNMAKPYDASMYEPAPAALNSSIATSNLSAHAELGLNKAKTNNQEKRFNILLYLCKTSTNAAILIIDVCR